MIKMIADWFRSTPVSRDKEVANLIAGLGAPTIKEKVAALNGLVRIGRDAIPALVATLARDENDVGTFAAATLERIGVVAIPALVDSLSGPGKARASVVLSKFGSRAVAPCIEALGGPGSIHAAVVLKDKDIVPNINDKDLVKIISKFAGEGQAHAHLVLAAVGAPAVGLLAHALRNPDKTVRVLAAMTLGEIGPSATAALPALRSAEKDAIKDVRDAATEAIQEINR